MEHLWQSAPAWAQFLAMNSDGEWWWFEHSPEMGCSLWFTRTGKSELALKRAVSWTHSVSARP